MNTWPLFTRRAMRSCREPSRVHTPATSPNFVAFASCTASSSSLKLIAASTGPNTSSCASRCVTGTSRSSVRDLLYQWADARAAGEADVVDARVARQRVADFMAVAGDDVDRAGGKARFGGQLRDADQRQASVFRRFDDADVAGRERAADTAP